MTTSATVYSPADPRLATGELALFDDQVRRVSWGSILAAAVTAIAAQLLFTTLGVAIGVTAASESSVVTDTAVRTISVAAGAWWVITGTLSLLLGGMVLGRLATQPIGVSLSLNGLTMWALTAIFGFLVISTAGSHAVWGLSGWNGTGVDAMNPSNGAFIAGTRPDTTAGVQIAAERAAAAARAVSWWSVVALLLGVAVSALGPWLTATDGLLAAHRRVEPRDRM